VTSGKAVGAEIFESHDGGETWASIASPGSLPEIVQFAASDGVLYLGCQKLYTATMGGVFRRDVSTNVEDPPEPNRFQLLGAYPNPFNPTTTIRYGLPIRTHVSLAVYNTLGQRVAELVNGEVEAGYHDVNFDASNLPSGVYFYRLQAGSYVETKKLLLIR